MSSEPEKPGSTAPDGRANREALLEFYAHARKKWGVDCWQKILTDAGCAFPENDSELYYLMTEYGIPASQLCGDMDRHDVLAMLAAGVKRAKHHEELSGPTTEPPADEEFVFALSGNGYYIKGFGEAGHLSSYKGLDVIARLIQSPGTPVAMTELTRRPKNERIAADRRSPQETMDKQAKRETYNELQEWRATLEKAQQENNTVEADEAQKEIDRLENELRAATGIGGKDRDMNNPLDKMRPAIYSNLTSAFKAIREAGMVQLAEHFDCSISSEAGTFIYRPAGLAITWQTEKTRKVTE